MTNEMGQASFRLPTFVTAVHKTKKYAQASIHRYTVYYAHTHMLNTLLTPSQKRAKLKMLAAFLENDGFLYDSRWGLPTHSDIGMALQNLLVLYHLLFNHLFRLNNNLMPRPASLDYYRQHSTQCSAGI